MSPSPMSPLVRTALGLIGLVGASTSACGAAAAGGEFLAGNATTPPGILIGMFLFSVGLTLGGGVIAERALWPSQRRRNSWSVYTFPGLLPTTDKAAAGPLSVGEGAATEESVEVDRLADRLRAEAERAAPGGSVSASPPTRDSVKRS
jgi:hypothetical protein